MDGLQLKETSVEMSAPSAKQWEQDPGHPGLRLRIRAEDAVIDHVRAVYSFSFEKQDRLFLNGYQSWTLSREEGIKGYDRSMRFCPRFLDRRYGFSAYGDGTFYPRKYRKGLQHGYSYGYIRRGDRYFFFGSLSEHTGFTRIIFDTKKNSITFEKDCSGRRVQGEYLAMDLMFAQGSEAEVFDGWFAAMGIKARTDRKLTGYTSWYNYYQNISEEILLKDAAGLMQMPVKPDLFQIDDGYETAVGDWLSIDPAKFPEGMVCVTEMIRKSGMRSGIWLAPFACEKKSALMREHPDWLLRDREGNPVYGGCNWGGMYALDICKEEVRSYVKTCIRYYRNLGFTFFKLDFLYAACLLPRPDKTRGEIMADAMELLREACGDCEILGCGVPLASAFGKVEYCRIGMDMSLSWDDAFYMRPFHSERPSTKHTLENTLYRRQLSGRAFLNDPDVFLLRRDNCRLSEERKLVLATLNGLLGGVLFTSDDYAQYNEDQKLAYAKVLRLQNAEFVSAQEENGTITVTYREKGKAEDNSFSWKK